MALLLVHSIKSTNGTMQWESPKKQSVGVYFDNMALYF